MSVIGLHFVQSVQLLSLLIMLSRLFFASFVCVGARGGLLSPLIRESPENCRMTNDDVDKALAVAKYMIAYETNTILDKGFHQDLPLSLLGIALPLTVSMNVSGGTLTSYETIVRSSNATGCQSSLTNTLEGDFEYLQNIELSYDSLSVQVHSWMAKGSLTYSLQPKVSLRITKGTDDCRLETFTLTTRGNIEYDVTTDNSWKGWLLGKALKWGLNQHDATQMLTIIVADLKDSVNSFFVPAWCDLINSI